MKFVMNSAAHINLALVVKRNKKSFFLKKEKNCLFKKSQGESLNIVCLIFLTFEIIQKKPNEISKKKKIYIYVYIYITK